MYTEHLIRYLPLVIAAALALPGAAQGQEGRHKTEHGGQVFHRFQLETGYGREGGHGAAGWDLDGWIGTDEHKLWLNSEGERTGGEFGEATVQVFYSRNIDTFWDAQAGIRHDLQPSSLSYLALGFEGLAPYFFETEAHAYLSEDGDVSFRLRQENDLLVTQRLILQPYLEAEAALQSAPELDLGSGLSRVTLGLQLRYEFTRGFAPYLDIGYNRTFGETADFAREEGEEAGSGAVAAGIRLLF